MGKFQWKTSYAEDIFRLKYAQGPNDTWPALARRVGSAVCGPLFLGDRPLLHPDEIDELVQRITQMKFIPGGRYLYYAGRTARFYNNCYCLKAEEDTREEWGRLLRCASDALMSGGGVGVDYSILRESGRVLKRTGGISSGPIPLMQSINEVGRNVMQGGSRRSALYASLNWQHGDIEPFLHIKDWPTQIVELKANDFNFPAPLDMTNISINWDTDFADLCLPSESSSYNLPKIWYESVRQMMRTGEPGHSYNFWEQEDHTLRNACAEFISDTDSDVCNLGSINLAAHDSLEDFAITVDLAAKFLICGSIRAELPYEKVYATREKNRRIGLGLMGVHEWLLRNGKGYEVDGELRQYLAIYRDGSTRAATEHAKRLYCSPPKSFRAIAPAGTIGILASTTTGIEPLYSVAYKRRNLVGKDQWKYQYYVDTTADRLIREGGLDPDSIETASDLARNPERRIKFQYDIQQYVDMGISSTINLPAWGTQFNNETKVKDMAEVLAKYCHGLRGITMYPDGARGGQPITAVKYSDALSKRGHIFTENEESCIGGICGI